MKQYIISRTTLNEPSEALELANNIINDIKNCGYNVHLDMSSSERMTVSFADALVMTILYEVGDDFYKRLNVTFSSDTTVPNWTIQSNWNDAVSRYKRGIRLSTQR